jgi:hypothetical protein
MRLGERGVTPPGAAAAAPVAEVLELNGPARDLREARIALATATDEYGRALSRAMAAVEVDAMSAAFDEADSWQNRALGAGRRVREITATAECQRLVSETEGGC